MFHSSLSSQTATDLPITAEERNFLLNDSIIQVPTPKTTELNDSMKKKNLTPTSLMLVRNIGGVECKKMLRVLFDSGGTKTFINKRVIPQNAKIITKPFRVDVETANGSMNANQFVRARDLYLPEFDKSKRIYGTNLQIFDNPNSSHDIIPGRDYLVDLGVDILSSKQLIKWGDHIVPWKHPQHWENHSNWTIALDKTYLDNLEDEDLADDMFILDAKYVATTPTEVAQQQNHLSTEDKIKLANALANTEQIFDGKLGHFRETQIHLDILPNATPFHSRPYSVPQTLEPAFKKELQHLIDIGVLEPVGRTEWASPTFIIPKKDGRVRWVSDLRELNKALIRKVYPLPLIDEVVSRRKAYKYLLNSI